MAKTSGHHARVLADGYNLSTVSQSLDISNAIDAHDVACLAEDVHYSVAGQKMTEFGHQGLFEQASAHAALAVPGEGVILTAAIGQGAAPAAGDPAFIFNTFQGQYQVNPSNTAAVPFNAAYNASGDDASRWGKILAAIATITNTTDGSTVDDGASSSNGGIATLHVITAAASDTYVVKVQHSTDGNSWSDLITFALDGSAIGAEFELATGTVNRYMRYQATRTGSAGDDFELAVAFARL